jgi:hypothetical protein
LDYPTFLCQASIQHITVIDKVQIGTSVDYLPCGFPIPARFCPHLIEEQPTPPVKNAQPAYFHIRSVDLKHIIGAVIIRREGRGDKNGGAAFAWYYIDNHTIGTPLMIGDE